MRCIAVIDLAAGQVVHAVRGEREHYRPIRSGLVGSAVPIAVADALREELGVMAFYVADLDAIQQRGSSRTIIEALLARHAACEWWIDAGVSSPATLEAYLSAPNATCVIGSESLRELADYHGIFQALPRPDRVVLSMDHRGGQFLGPAALWSASSQWPQKVIAMNLDRVGAASGPDLGLLGELKRQAPTARVAAAGGVRHAQDLEALAAAGASDVLIATALHDGRLRRQDLERHVLAAHSPDS